MSENQKNEVKKYPIHLSLVDFVSIPDENLDECCQGIGDSIKITVRLLRAKAKESELGEEKAILLLAKAFDFFVEFIPDGKDEIGMKIIRVEGDGK
jgi:hypothetical protein